MSGTPHARARLRRVPGASGASGRIDLWRRGGVRQWVGKLRKGTRRSTMADIKVAVINASTVLTDAQVQAVVPAPQTKVHSHFAPAWGLDAALAFVPKTPKPAPGGVV